MKINLSEYPDFKSQIRQFDPERINEEHRRGSSFYCDILVNITQDDLEWLQGKLDTSAIPPDLVGMWLSNTIMRYDEWGVEWSDLSELTKVERKERQVTTTEVYYEPVNQ